MTIFPRRLFLIDGFGAVLSTFLLGVVLVKLEAQIGMPRHELRWLAIVAALFAIYDFSCYFIKPKNWRLYLTGIAIANLIYCLVSVGVLIYYAQRLTVLGWLYFLIEIMIVVLIAGIELKTVGTID